MKLSDLRAETETTFTPLDSDGEALDITIHSKTFATAEWKASRTKFSVDDAVYYDHENGMKLGAPLEDNELNAVACLVTNIEGIDDWTFSRENVTEFFLNPAFASIPQQLHQHLKALGNGLKNTSKTPAKKPSNT